MDKANFVVHHVGGRFGTRGFPLVKALEHEIISVIYEASSDGNEQIIAYGRANGTGETVLVNACVGRPGSTRLFNVNLDPYTSSLLSPNSRFANYYMAWPKFDYVMGDVMSPVTQTLMLTESLDEIVSSRKLPSCDFLSLDTQGSELEILESAVGVLEGAVSVMVEVEFVEMYKGQPLFGDVDKFMRSHGFGFIRFSKFDQWAPRVVGVEGRGEKMQVSTNALYFKQQELLTQDQLYPMIFTALAFGQTEYALSIAKQMSLKSNVSDKKEWMKFVDDFVKIATTFSINRKTFNDFHSVEESFARFTLKKSGFKRLLPRCSDVVSFLKKTLSSMPQLEAKVANRLLKRRVKKMVPSDLEKLFVEIGLPQVAKRLKHSRQN